MEAVKNSHDSQNSQDSIFDATVVQDPVWTVWYQQKFHATTKEQLNVVSNLFKRSKKKLRNNY